ncbi:MAG: hypothetical protein ACYTGA_09580, partial [Planctomycetota bacterium]
MSPHRRTLRNMYDIDWYPYGYYCKNNKWPDEASWKEDIKEFIKNTLPYTKPETLDYCFIDGWENPIQYRIVDHNDTQTVLLYSFGKNKVDDNGTGDDITREIEVPTQKDIDHYKAKTKAATTGGVML